MFYVKLDNNKNLTVTVREPLYRGENLSGKIIYLVPTTVDEVDIAAATIYLSYIRPDGVADVITLQRMEDKYNEQYFQYTVPVTCKMTKFAGSICTWMQIYSGDPVRPMVLKSGECMIWIEESKDMDDYLCDHQIASIYALQKQVEASVEELKADIAGKADNITFHPEDSTIQLMSGDTPIGDRIVISSQGGKTIINMIIKDDKCLYATYSDGTEKNLGKVVGEDGKIYIPHMSEDKILSWTIEDAPGDVPEPVDLDPNDEWDPIDDDGETNYHWSNI